MERVRSTAINYARRNFRIQDEQFVDECIAEAYYWLVLLFEEHLDELKKQEDTIAYIRMKVAYKLKEYWAPYASSTISYKKKHGESLPQTVELNDEHTVPDTDIACFICLQSVLRTQQEWDIYEQHLLGKQIKEISKALQIRSKRVQKTLTRICKRLKNAKRGDDANIPTSC